MPPLHRMPVAYLALLVAGGAGLAAFVPGRNSPEPAASEPSGTEPPRPATADRLPHPIPADATPSDGILRTADGLRRKVLIRSLGLRCRSKPRDGAPVGEEPGLYSLWYLHDESPGLVRVGRDGVPVGWLPAEGVLEWDTRVMVRPVAPGVVLFQERSCLLDRLAGRPCPQHPGDDACPGARLPDGAEDRAVPMGLPVLRAEAIPDPDGPDRTLFEVASLVRDSGQAPPVRIAEGDREALRDIDIALVMDTTGSMESYIKRAKELARALAADAGERYKDVRLHLALVEYRDDRDRREPAGYEFTTRITCPFAEPAEFLRSLDKVQATTYGDGSVAEKVLEGLATALPPSTADPADALHHLKWPRGRAGELATKLIVLIGDAPDHSPDATAAAATARKLKEAGITLAAVSIRNPNLLPAERDRYQAQWRALAEGAYRPLDREAKFERSIPPLTLALDDAGALLPGLQRLIDDRIERARQLAELVRAEIEGRQQEYRNRQGLTLDQVALVLEDLRLAATPPESRAATGDLRKAPQVRRGWLAEREGGRRLLRVEMLMSRDELDRLIEDLRQFQQAIVSGASRPEDLIGLLSASASGERGFLEQERGGETFADYLRRRGLPPARPESLLNRRQADLLQTDRLARDELNEALGRAIAALTARREADDWDDPTRLVDGVMSSVPYEPIDF